MDRKKISVAIPCYNEEEVIAMTYKSLNHIFSNQEFDYELVFVDDGSSDKTTEILRGFAETDDKVKVFLLSRNFGHQAAVSAALHKAEGDAVIIIDADLQDPPQVILQLIDVWQNQGFDVVYGKRTERDGETIFKRLSAHIFYRLLNSLSDIKFPEDTGDFRLIDRKVVLAYRQFNERNKYLRGLFSWMGFSQIAVPYHRDARKAGKTKYTMNKMLKLASDGIFNFSKKPLMLATGFGALSIFVGLGVAIWMLIVHFIIGNTVPGWSSVIAVITFFGGVQLLSMGIMGRYIASIFDEVKGRPEFLIKESFNSDK